MVAHTSKNKTVLVVEDDDNLRFVLCEMIRQLGFEAQEADNGLSALTQIDQAISEVHIMLTDLRMPTMDGKTLLAELKTRGVQFPILVLTAFGTVADAVECMKNGAFDFVMKPIDFETLREKLEAASSFRENSKHSVVAVPSRIANPNTADFKEILREQTQSIERQLIAQALQELDGNVTRTADRLGISRKGLQLKMKELGLRE